MFKQLVRILTLALLTSGATTLHAQCKGNLHIESMSSKLSATYKGQGSEKYLYYFSLHNDSSRQMTGRVNFFNMPKVKLEAGTVVLLVRPGTSLKQCTA